MRTKIRKKAKSICYFQNSTYLCTRLRTKNIRFDSLAQQVEHNTFNVGVLGSSPKRITQKKLFDNENYQGVFFVKHPSSSIKRQSKKGNIPQANYNICHFDILISVLCVTTTIAI